MKRSSRSSLEKRILSLASLSLFPLTVKRLLAARQRRRGRAAVVEAGAPRSCTADRQVRAQAAEIAAGCTRCGVCLVQCPFLKRYGMPGDICEAVDPAAPETTRMAYACSLCGLCRSVCPENLDPGAWFMALRRAAVESGRVDLADYKTILGYEKIGTSALFSYYAFPPGCDTVFFPGCTLPGTRPETTWRLFRFLSSRLPSLGIVLDCCTKPSHDLGRQEHFAAMFGEMLACLKANGIRRVWLACPSCHQVFRDYAAGITVETVYEVLDRTRLPDAGRESLLRKDAELVVHDPCPMRNETAAQAAVRSLLAKMDVPVGNMPFERQRTTCCGEGGSVGFVDKALIAKWTSARKKMARGRPIVTYCAGCARFLGRVTPTLHIADLLFSRRSAVNGSLPTARAPFTYFHRLMFKRRLKATLGPAASRVRRYPPRANPAKRRRTR